jgi:hypothetical protein
MRAFWWKPAARGENRPRGGNDVVVAPTSLGRVS